jgi:hypothetical protein
MPCPSDTSIPELIHSIDLQASGSAPAFPPFRLAYLRLQPHGGIQSRQEKDKARKHPPTVPRSRCQVALHIIYHPSPHRVHPQILNALVENCGQNFTVRLFCSFLAGRFTVSEIAPRFLRRWAPNGRIEAPRYRLHDGPKSEEEGPGGLGFVEQAVQGRPRRPHRRGPLSTGQTRGPVPQV